MSDATLQAVHDAIAAHIADENNGDAEYLTEWVFVAAAAISTDASTDSYYVCSSDSPKHHIIGLLHYGRAKADNDFEDSDD